MIVYLVGSFAGCCHSVLCYDFIAVEDGVNICMYTQKEINVNICYIGATIVNIVLSNMACVLVIVILTIMISTRLLKYKKKRSKLRNDGDSGKEFQISLMLVIVATLFLILRIPEMITYEMFHFFLAQDASNPMLNDVFTVYPIFMTLLALNHSTNFFIYMAFLKNFRDTFKGLFKCIKYVKSGT